MMSASHPTDINKIRYQWCVRAFAFLHERLGINVKEHDADGNIAAGQIFLFNHFARFETVIPQYIIHQATGAFCRCVASSELFAENENFAKFLWSVGAVPSNHPGLLSFLAAEILRGRKVIVFPEGGMIKDRRVLDDDGQFNILSPTTQASRKHHKGAAATALTLEIFKKRILSVYEDNDTARLLRWVDALGLDNIDALVAAARKPTLVVPSNITFYPIHTDDNIIRKGAQYFGLDMSDRVQEELLIESNILLKRTDMDVRFGAPISPDIVWNFWDRFVLKRVFDHTDSLEDLFALKDAPSRWVERMLATALLRETKWLRDVCMWEIYARVTVNLSHLASRLIMTLAGQGITEIDHDRFHRLLYVAIKNAQNEPSIHLHRSLTNPEAYEGIHCGSCRGFDQFLEAAVSSGLIEAEPDRYRFLPKLQQKHDLHEVRLENMVAVYANEIAPLSGVCRAVEQAMQSESATTPPMLSRLLFDDEVRAYTWCKKHYSKPRHAQINEKETKTESGEPYLLMPENIKKVGVVLVHGLLASPAELREFGEILAGQGHPVIVVRLKGHGTSPWDLRDRTWSDWLDSVRRGYEIIAGLVDQVCLVGFSTGGSLALHLAAEQPRQLVGAAVVSAPLKFRNGNLVFVPFIHGVNKLAEWVPSLEGVMPFQPNDSEHPHINYRHIPIRGLFELRRLTDELKRRLSDIVCSTIIIQGDEDSVVAPKSAEMIYEKIGSVDKSIHIVSSTRHGILSEDIGDTQSKILTFISKFVVPQEDNEQAASGVTSNGLWIDKLKKNLADRSANAFEKIGGDRNDK